MYKYNNKQEENQANKVLLAIVILTCIIIAIDYITI